MFVRVIALLLCLGVTGASAIAESPDFAMLARASGTPEIPGLKIVWLSPWGDVAKTNPWRHIIVHRTEGGGGTAKYGAIQQPKNTQRRGVTDWVEADGRVYWAVPEDAIPTHGDGANRNDNKYIDNEATFRHVLKGNSLGGEFAGNFPDVARPASAEQIAEWRILVRVLQARYGIGDERIYAHNWIDTKDRATAKAATLRRWRAASRFRQSLEGMACKLKGTAPCHSA